MAEPFKKILDISFKFGFLKKLGLDDSFEHLSFGPLGLLIGNNICKEWLKSNVINTDLNVSLYDSQPNGNWQEDCQASFSHSLQITNEQLPFGLASILTNFTPVTNERHNLNQSTCLTNAYRCLVFINHKDSQQYFYRLQRRRKFWWRQFSTDPERFSMTEEKYDGGETIQISAKFPWETAIVETIHNHGNKPLAGYHSLFEAKAGRKLILPDVIESICLERPAVMTYLCDAFQQLPYRTMLRIHRGLAPYKVALAVDPTSEKVEEINQLAKYLSLNLRKVDLHTLFSTGNCSKAVPLESQFNTHDLVGVPYTIVVKDDTLVNGIVGLRSRDTTLQEQVHVSRLTSYMQQLLT